MGIVELNDIKHLFVKDESGSSYIGGNQYWYPKEEYFQGGACGATTATNVLAYMLRLQPELDTKTEYIGFMKKVYPYFVPSRIGLHAPWYVKGMKKITADYGFHVNVRCLKVPIRPFNRPSFEETADFIGTALSMDVPVAFLALSGGNVKYIYKWHWMTIIGIDEENRKIKILDNNEISWAELDLWLRKSILGGAFVRAGTDQ